MKINKTIIALSVLAVALTSCGSSQKKNDAKAKGPDVVRPATTVIKGDLQEYFTVLDKGYTVKQTGEEDDWGKLYIAPLLQLMLYAQTRFFHAIRTKSVQLLSMIVNQ